MTLDAIRATFSDFRTVKSRKVAQLVMEVPIEQADAALRTLGGVPRPDVDRWVGIAPITEEAARRIEPQPRRWEDLSYAQQSGIRCSDEQFQTWIGVNNPQSAAEKVRDYCRVSSRAELDTDADAAQRWRDMDQEFRTRNIG